MRLFRKIITSPEVEQAYDQFMLNFEIQALRITCYFGGLHVFLFLIIDYWRVENYTYVFNYRVSALIIIALIILLSYTKNLSVTYYNFLCVVLSTVLPLLFYLLDFTGVMPVFFAPNAMLLFFYVFNSCLGHSFRIKVIHTTLMVIAFLAYALYFSPHRKFHQSQVWNVVLNTSMSLLIGYLIVSFKRLSFVRQEQVIESNSKLDLALQSVEMGVWSWNLKTDLPTVDKKILKLFGLRDQSFRGTSKDFLKMVHPEDRDRLKKFLKSAIETKAPFSLEYRAVWPDGSIHHIKARAKVFTDLQGNPLNLRGISWDVSEQKKIEQELKDQENALKESESKFRQISETINDVFYLYNIIEKKYEFISKNCEEILGAPPDFFYSGKKYNATFVVDDDKEKMMKANEMVDAGTAYEVDYRILNNGEIKWIREKSFPIKDEFGKAVKNSGICTDITHLKLQEIQLLAQKRHLEALNNTKDKFFSIVAHDLKSPLNSLKGFTSLLIDHADRLSKEEITQASKKTQLAIDNTIKLADNLITWARLQMNEQETKQEKINFSETVSTILPVYMRIAEKKGITLSWSFDDSLTLFADKNHVQFIVRNLLNNAIKFTNKEGNIKLSAIPLANGEMQISVSDNGVGIPEEKKKQIFSLGKSQSSNGTAGEKGTGLGLMLCHEFIKLNGGVIEVESEEGKGTTFNVRLKRNSYKN